MPVNAYTTRSLFRICVVLVATSGLLSIMLVVKMTLYSNGHIYGVTKAALVEYPVKYDDKKGVPNVKQHLTIPVPRGNSRFCSPFHVEVVANRSIPTWAEVESRVPGLEEGGHYVPSNCRAWNKVVLIVPYRDRENHLKLFLRHMHGFLQAQGIEYTIYVVELEKDVIFKKGLLMNAGFIESAKLKKDTRCFIFHDVDMLPLNTKLLYTCRRRHVQHLSTYVKQYKFKQPYNSYMGGVVSFRKADFELVNGFSNLYWGWGGEDDDIFQRIKAMGMVVTRPFSKELHYESWPHTREKEFVNRRDLVKKAVERMDEDGINSAKGMYHVLSIDLNYLYTRIYVSANQTDGSYKDFKPVYGKYNPKVNLIKEQIPGQ